MIRSRMLVVCLVSLVAALALPAVGSAQTAGQSEYGGVAGATAGSPPSGVAGAQTSGSRKKTAASEPTPFSQRTTDSLPFTGRDIALMLFGGIGLVGLGVVLRTAARRSTAGA